MLDFIFTPYFSHTQGLGETSVLVQRHAPWQGSHPASKQDWLMAATPKTQQPLYNDTNCFDLILCDPE